MATGPFPNKEVAAVAPVVASQWRCPSPFDQCAVLIHFHQARHGCAQSRVLQSVYTNQHQHYGAISTSALRSETASLTSLANSFSIRHTHDARLLGLQSSWRGPRVEGAAGAGTITVRKNGRRCMCSHYIVQSDDKKPESHLIGRLLRRPKGR